MKPWLQGRLALSQQTSRFELPMDVKLLAGKKNTFLITNFFINLKLYKVYISFMITLCI